MNAVVNPTPSNDSASTSTPSDDAGVDFGELAVHEDVEPVPEPVSGKEGAPATAAAPPASPQPAPQSAPAAAVPPVEPQAAAPPPLPPAEPQASQPPAATVEPPATSQPPELTLEQHREKFIPELEKLYALSDAEVEDLRVNPGVALPKLAARLHYEVHMAVYQGLAQMMPQQIELHYQQNEARTSAESKFYKQWPKLQEAAKSNSAHKVLITSAIDAYRKVNPKASLDDVIANAGMIAMRSLKLPLDEQQAAPAAPAPALPPQTPSPVRPPGAGASGHMPVSPPPGDEGSIFAELTELHERGEI